MKSLLALATLSLSLTTAAIAGDETRIAVMTAFEPEWKAMQGKLSNTNEVEINGTTFLLGELEGKDVVLFMSGVSMVNAAMTTQLALDNFNISSIVFSGIAGGVNPSYHIGDVIVPAKWGQYLEALFAREVDGQFVPPSWVKPEWPNYGMIFPRSVDIARPGGKIEEKFWFETDPELLKIAEQVAGELDLLNCVEANKCLTHKPEIHVGGNGVSGQAFMDNAAFRDYAYSTFEASVLDMESAAVAHVADVNGVPFIAFRSLSDLAGGGEGENEMGTFFGLASQNSAAVVTAFVKALPEQDSDVSK